MLLSLKNPSWCGSAFGPTNLTGPSPQYGQSPAVVWLRRRGGATTSQPAAKPNETGRVTSDTKLRLQHQRFGHLVDDRLLQNKR